MKIIDSHTHINSDILHYYGISLDELVKYNLNKLDYAFNIGYDIKTSKEVLKINKKFKDLIPVIGIHPSGCNSYNPKDFKVIEALVNSNVAAIGEIGLDYFHKPFNRENQIKGFEAQIKIAKKFNMPIVVHSRDAFEDTWNIIRNYPNIKFLLHSWSASIELTKKILSERDNIWFSFSGVITFKNATLNKELLKLVPINRVLFETDSPWLTPVPFRGKENYTFYIKYIIGQASRILEIDFKKLNIIHEQNIEEFYWS